MQRMRQVMSDLEVIGLSLTAEYIGIESENNLFRILPSFFKSRIECKIYNRRKYRLMLYGCSLPNPATNSVMCLLWTVCSWKSVKSPAVPARRSVKMNIITGPAKDTVLRKWCTIIGINFNVVCPFKGGAGDWAYPGNYSWYSLSEWYQTSAFRFYPVGKKVSFFGCSAKPFRQSEYTTWYS